MKVKAVELEEKKMFKKFMTHNHDAVQTVRIYMRDGKVWLTGTNSKDSVLTAYRFSQLSASKKHFVLDFLSTP